MQEIETVDRYLPVLVSVYMYGTSTSVHVHSRENELFNKFDTVLYLSIASNAMQVCSNNEKKNGNTS